MRPVLTTVLCASLLAACSSSDDDCGSCSPDATCTAGKCVCKTGFDGNGKTCTVWVDEARRACAQLQAEHPGYTTIARDVALCGSKYGPGNISTACHTGWHVCRKTEWLAKYPLVRPYKTAPADADLIGPTLGTLTSWGVAQSARCGGGVWQSLQPTSAEVWTGSVCHVPDDVGTNNVGADYLPYNDGKFLLADDGTTVQQGYNAEGEPDCCSWDVSVGPPVSESDFAVYCCVD